MFVASQLSQAEISHAEEETKDRQRVRAQAVKEENRGSLPG
jgi:hypothetical protein